MSKTNEDSSITIAPSYSDADTSDTHSFTVNTTNTTGAVTVNDDGTFSYDPNGQFEGLAAGESITDTFSYTVTDSSGESSTNTVTVTINGVNDAPIAATVTASTDEDSSVTITPDYSDVDSSNTHSFLVNTTDTAGSVTVNEDGTFFYDPTNLVGSLGLGETFIDTFTYTVADSAGESSTAIMTVTGDSEIFSGSTGDDTYSIWADSGSSMIDYTIEVADGGYDTIVFEDLSLSDLTITTVEHDDGSETALKIFWKADGNHSAGQLQIANMGENIERYEFADRTTLSEIDPPRRENTRLFLKGTSEDDLIFGGKSSDYIQGSDGDDVMDAKGHSGYMQFMEGKKGNDTYYYGMEAAEVRISHYAEREEGSTSDSVIFKDLTLQDFAFSTFTETDHNGEMLETLLMSWEKGGPSGSIEFYDMGQHIERFEFADGTTLSAIEVFDEGRVQLTGTDDGDTITGADKGEDIYGGDGNNVLVGGTDMDWLYGGAGADIIDGGGDHAHALYHHSDAGVTINLATGEAYGGHAEGDKLIRISAIDGSEYNDYLTGNAQDDWLHGLGGDDVLTGEDGNDVFVFTSEEPGNDIITDFTAGEETEDVIRFNADVFADAEAVLAAATDDGTDTVIT